MRRLSSPISSQQQQKDLRRGGGIAREKEQVEGGLLLPIALQRFDHATWPWGGRDLLQGRQLNTAHTIPRMPCPEGMSMRRRLGRRKGGRRQHEDKV
ncbi:prepronociceptin [Lates japonicus]|uniref:Prepronociceptin n=1 Tax=Lates japonicus TaxID=270547 RepID=A0AAD3ML74_LATJO|nr:prepronociceptin [Lates japonicus]